MGTKTIEDIQLVPAFLPVDLAAGNVAGDFVSLKHYGRCAIVLQKTAGGTDGEDPTITVVQATAVAGTGAKALNFTSVAVKQAATNLDAVGEYTVVTQAGANTFTTVDSAQEALIWVIEFNAEDLDVTGGFDCIGVSIADVGAGLAQLASCLYVLSEPRYPQAILPSAIVD